MKKLLFLSFCLIWLPLFSSAQIIQGESTTTQTLFVPEKKIPEKGYPRYQGDIYLGYAGDDICLSLTTTHGIRINKYLFAGAGIGIEYGDLWFYHNRYKDWLCETSNIPLFINLKGYYPVAKKIEPYVSLSLGYAYNIDEYSGFYCDASIGIRLWKFCVGIGFIHHECTGLTGEDYYNNTFEDELWTRNKFQVKIGFQW